MNTDIISLLIIMSSFIGVQCNVSRFTTSETSLEQSNGFSQEIDIFEDTVDDTKLLSNNGNNNGMLYNTIQKNEYKNSYVYKKPMAKNMKRNMQISGQKQWMANQILSNVYPKEIIDSAELDKNAPVIDFDDYSDEEVNLIKTGVNYQNLKQYNPINDFVKKSTEITNARRKRDTMGRDKLVKKEFGYRKVQTHNVEDNEKNINYHMWNKNIKFKLLDKLTMKSYNNKYNTATGMANTVEMKSKTKRNTNNMIEEENLGTTISGFKFTGRSLHLNHELTFKNIHT